MGYTKDTAIGFSWLAGLRVLTRVVAFAKIAILARLLSPEQFGVFGVAVAALTLFETVSQTGISVFLVQEKQKMVKYLDSAFFVSIARGLFIVSTIYLSAPFLANFFKSGESISLIRFIGLVGFIRGFINPARVNFLKDLQYDKEFLFSLGIFLFDTFTSIVITFYLRTSIGLVYGLIAGAILEVVLSFVFIRLKPHLNFEIKKIIYILQRGKWIAGSTNITYVLEQGPDMFIAKFLNTQALGIYQMAYKISTIPLTEVAKVLNQVSFPIYVKLTNEPMRLKKAFFKICLTTLFLTIPIGYLLYYYSSEIALLLLGEKWLAVAPVIKLLSIFGVARAILISTNPLFNALKRQDNIAKISLVNLVLMLLIMTPFIYKNEIAGVAGAITLSLLATIPLTYYYLRKVLV